MNDDLPQQFHVYIKQDRIKNKTLFYNRDQESSLSFPTLIGPTQERKKTTKG